MDFRYRPFVHVDDLASGEATIHRAERQVDGGGTVTFWHVWFWVADAVDGQLMPVTVPVIPDGAFTEDGPGGRSWGLNVVDGSWKLTPSVNVLNDDNKTLHPGEHPLPSHWHEWVTLTGVPLGSVALGLGAR